MRQPPNLWALDLPLKKQRSAVVDPLTAYLGAEVNAHRDTDIRRALFPLGRLAEETGAAVLVVRHLNKGGSSNPLYRGGGSIGIIGAARSGLLVAKDRPGQSGSEGAGFRQMQPGQAAGRSCV